MWAGFVAGGLIGETRACPDAPPQLLETQPQGVAGSGALNLTMDPLPAVRPYTGTFPIVDTAHFNTPLSGTVDVQYTIEAIP